MDQGVAAVWAAGIGVGGALIGAGMGLIGSIVGGKKQADAAIAGARAQAQGEQEQLLWQGRRDAYASFLGEIEAVRMAIAHMYAKACSVEEGDSSGAELTDAKNAVSEAFKRLWFRQSALRLSVESSEAESAETLMNLASRAVLEVSDFADAVWAHRDTELPGQKVRETTAQLTTDVKAWVRTARGKLGLPEEEIPTA